MGRPMIPITATQIRMVTEAYSKDPAGVVRIVKRLRQNTYRVVYRIMKKNGTAGSSPAKSEWVRYERKYSNAMWHVDWHVMKDERFRGLNLIDDASRCIVGAALFGHATSENAVLLLRLAMKRFGAPTSRITARVS